jgi:hypothetical protein
MQFLMVTAERTGFMCQSADLILGTAVLSKGRSGKLLLVLARTVILGSGSRGTHDRNFLSHDFWTRADYINIRRFCAKTIYLATILMLELRDRRIDR